jgi:hypothetical protein
MFKKHLLQISAALLSSASLAQAQVVAKPESVVPVLHDDEAARTRCAAARFLGSVDCRQYPEIEIALIAALRTDRVEAVRYETAIALGNSPAISPKLLDALNAAAVGNDLDGQPKEISDRVRKAARASLDRCARGPSLAPTTQPIGEPRSLPISVQSGLEQERQAAATVSTTAKTSPPAPSRPVYNFFLRLLGRGADANGVIPATPPAPAQMPYNHN